MGEKRPSVVDMIEAELLEEQQRANQRPTSPPKELFARVAIGDDAAIAPTAKKERPRRVIEQVTLRHDPRRDETDPPPPPSASDPHRSVTKPPPPGYGSGETG
jgi:hypothetical protein